MHLELGIGVVTYNRRSRLISTLKQIRDYTKVPCELVVVDDGSTDDSVAVARSSGFRCITGRNSGIASNKNRALFYLHETKFCQRIILIEDDTAPLESGWENNWISAIDKWGHVNIATEAHSRYSASGVGTIDDPMMCTVISAQCAGFSREALSYVGYFDARYGKYGGEHVEHSRRLLRAGYGGRKVSYQGKEIEGFYSIKSPLAVYPEQSFGNENNHEFSRLINDIVSTDMTYRSPFYNDMGMKRLRAEIKESF